MDYVDDSGDAFEEYIVYHPKFLEWMKVAGIEARTNYTELVAEAFDCGLVATLVYELEVVAFVAVVVHGLDYLSVRNALGPKFLEWMKVAGIEARTNYTQDEIDEIVSRSPREPSR